MATTLADRLARNAASFAIDAESHDDLHVARALGLRSAAMAAEIGDYPGAAFVAWAAEGATSARRLELNDLATVKHAERLERGAAA